MSYEFVKKDSLTGYILDVEKDEIVCIVGTKRPDLEFDSLKGLLEKANNYEDLCE